MWAGDFPVGDGLLDVDVGVHRAFGFEVAQDGKTMGESDLRIARRQDGAVRNGLLEELLVVVFRGDIPLEQDVGVGITKPGRTVAWERSISSTPGGGEPPGVTLRILSPSMRMRAFEMGASLLQSIRRPARMATRLCAGGEDCWAGTKVLHAERRKATARSFKR